jgi:hypothetical protein
VPGLTACGTIDNLQLVFPEIGRAADSPERSRQKAAVIAADYANPSSGECFAAIVTTRRANPSPGKCSAPDRAASGPGECFQ